MIFEIFILTILIMKIIIRGMFVIKYYKVIKIIIRVSMKV